MAMLETTKMLKGFGAACGLKKNEVRVQVERRFVGKHLTAKGTMINLYEIRDIWAHVNATRIGQLPHADAKAIVNALAKIGPCEVAYFESKDESRIVHIMFRSAYSPTGEGHIRNVTAESKRLQAIIAADEAKYGKLEDTEE